jgi:type I restriction enzyme, S subunit
MQRWEIKTLGEIAEVQSGGTPLKARNEYWFGDIPWYSSGELNETFTQASKSFITKKGLEDSNAKLFPKGSLLIGMYDTAALKMSILDRDAAFNQAIAGVKSNENIDLRFILLAIESRRFEILNQRRGVRQKNLSLAKIKNIELSVPPLPEQKRIVAILDEAFEGIDRAIANTEKNLANARKLFESYLSAIFTHKGDGWEEKILGDVCKKVEYGSSAKSLTEGEVPVLRMGNIQDSAIDWSDLVYTINKEEINKYLLRHNDILFNRTNSAEHVVKTAIYKSQMPAIFAGYLIRIHRKEDLIDADFLNFYLNSDIAREYGKSIMSRSVNQANINGTKLKSYPISIPSLSEQKQIVQDLSFLSIETRKLEAIYRKKLTALNELKQSILQKAFTGELTADTANQAIEAAEEDRSISKDCLRSTETTKQNVHQSGQLSLWS